jgi:hypothetical protein
MDPTKQLQTAAKRYADAREARDRAIREAAAAGLTGRAIAEIVGLSHQRIHQIVSAK